MRNKRPSPISKYVFKACKSVTRLVYSKMKIIGIEDIPSENTVIVANHAQLSGPIIAELYMPENCFIWANGQMMSYKDVPEYAMEDFFSYKKPWQRPVFRIVSYLLAPILPCVMKNARVIPVYHDARIASTLKSTVKMLAEGKNILIFPECHIKCNNIINQMQESFVDVAKLYYKRTRKCLNFLPMYIAPKLHRCYFGEMIRFDPNENISDERHRITEHIAVEITRIGCMLPEHTVIPFDNISRKEYISNKDVDSLPE